MGVSEARQNRVFSQTKIGVVAPKAFQNRGFAPKARLDGEYLHRMRAKIEGSRQRRDQIRSILAEGAPESRLCAKAAPKWGVFATNMRQN